jgi:hypothetical protein
VKINQRKKEWRSNGQMKLKISINNIEWWFWTVTLVFIVSAISGWGPGYYIVMGISLVQVVYFTLKTKSLISFDTQVRIVYFAIMLLGLWSSVRLVVYIIMLLGTLMVVFFDRCSIALILKQMPWNKSTDQA